MLCVCPQSRAPLSRAPLQELYDPSMESSAANLDDLQKSWETLKNVVGPPPPTPLPGRRPAATSSTWAVGGLCLFAWLLG